MYLEEWPGVGVDASHERDLENPVRLGGYLLSRFPLHNCYPHLTEVYRPRALIQGVSSAMETFI